MKTINRMATVIPTAVNLPAMTIVVTLAILAAMTFVLSASPVLAGVPTTGQAAKTAAASTAGTVRVVDAGGDFRVRHGASEEWTTAAVGDVLKPEDSIRLGKGAWAMLESDGKELLLPELVIMDIADLREITRTDLLLKLAMEDVRSVPRPEPKLGNPGDVKTTTTRAGDRDAAETAANGSVGVNSLRLGGAQVLHENGYFGTCILRSREIFRVEPALAGRSDARLRVADALERMNLREEAYEAYAAISPGNLSAKELLLVEGKLAELKEAPETRGEK